MNTTRMAPGYCICPVCNQRHTDSLLFSVQLAAELAGPEAFMGWALCPTHELMALQGFVALVEVTSDPEVDNYIEQLEQAERTGNIVHILRARWHAVFDHPQPAGAMAFITPDVMADAKLSDRLSLH